MEELELKVIKSIQRLTENNIEVEVKLVYKDIFGELNNYNETKFLMILEQLKNKNRILINNNMVSIKESDLLIVYHEYEDLSYLRVDGLNFNEIQTDIGHGWGIPAMGLELIKFAFKSAGVLLSLGTTISDIRNAIEQLKWFKGLLKESFTEQRIIYYSDEILEIIAANKIIEEYKSINIRSLKLIDKLKINLNVGLGLYSREHYGFSDESLEGRPDTLNYLVFELVSDDLNNLFDIIRIEIRSTGEIMSYNIKKSDI